MELDRNMIKKDPYIPICFEANQAIDIQISRDFQVGLLSKGLAFGNLWYIFF